MKWAILDLPAWAEQDYRLWNDTQYKGIPLKMLPSITSNNVCYNQLEFEKEFWDCLCTQYFWIIMHSNNTNKPISLPIRHQLCENRVKINFDPKVWWYLVDWIKNTIDTLKDWIMYRVHKTDIKTLLDKGYVVWIGMYTWLDINTARADWKITIAEMEKIVNAKYWHATCLRKNVWLNSYEWVIANNKVEIENIDEYLKSWFIYDWGYLICPNFVLRDFYTSLLKWKNQLVWQEYYNKIEKELYPREKLIFQWVMQKLYIWKITSQELKNISF